MIAIAHAPSAFDNPCIYAQVLPEMCTRGDVLREIRSGGDIFAGRVSQRGYLARICAQAGMFFLDLCACGDIPCRFTKTCRAFVRFRTLKLGLSSLWQATPLRTTRRSPKLGGA